MPATPPGDTGKTGTVRALLGQVELLWRRRLID